MLLVNRLLMQVNRPLILVNVDMALIVKAINVLKADPLIQRICLIHQHILMAVLIKKERRIKKGGLIRRRKPLIKEKRLIRENNEIKENN